MLTLSESYEMTKVQFISNEKGKPTGVVVPIKQWEAIQNELNYLVPEWHKKVVRARVANADEPLLSWEEVKASLNRKS